MTALVELGIPFWTLLILFVHLLLADLFVILKITHSLPRAVSFTQTILLVGLSFAFSLLGFAIGFMSADSRESVLGVVLPALLTLVSGLIVYLFSKEDAVLKWLSVSTIIGALSIATIVGAVLGSEPRMAKENLDRYLEVATYQAKKSIDQGKAVVPSIFSGDEVDGTKKLDTTDTSAGSPAPTTSNEKPVRPLGLPEGIKLITQ